MGDTREHAGRRACQRLLSKTGVLHGLPGRLQQQTLLRIDRNRLPLADAKELAIEIRGVIQETAPLAHRPTGHARLRVVELVAIPPVRRHLGDQVVAS
ncbi:Uncharacterised protein [Mycobacterium tuberculosis]|uniref:Uncharacterized protein n=1 Tax=Mycobacterium tuberculosis TaxID=1773 RepID=A0A654TGZ3_MYCTX|nr:Uncharacterised protein [Mycobacterium tuberculosis]CFE47082.1 Uncharacterised protein [Mycobacterium tuberculosis]CFR91714.1 Uncharacterised protein [Mycobacterium tuberculosis]CKQ87484.1 Uncharacterised protein [Mycobacterium tuberculosis]CKR57561.1 Uncharacterised protein [Mycobacterium tuberculosis]